MDSNGSEIRKTQQKAQQGREKLEQKTQEERSKMVNELIRETREERKKIGQKTQEQGTRMMQKVAAHISARSTEEREKMVQKIQELTTRVMQKLAARNSVAVEERKKMEQRARIQKLIQKELESVSLRFGSDFYTSNRFEGYKKSIWVNDDNARSATRVFFDVVPRPGKDDDVSFKKPCKIIDPDYSCCTLNVLASPERVDPFSDKALGAELRTCFDARRKKCTFRWIEDVIVQQILYVEEAREGKVAVQEEEPKKSKKRNMWDK